jgi:hypothetical protein
MLRLSAVGSVDCWLHKKLVVEVKWLTVKTVSCRKFEFLAAHDTEIRDLVSLLWVRWIAGCTLNDDE